jgi:hypothetical protein
MKKRVTSWVLALGLLAASAFAHASIVVNTAPKPGNTTEFSIFSDVAVNVLGVSVTLVLPSGVFGPVDPLPDIQITSDAPASAWNPTLYGSPNGLLDLTVLGLVENDLLEPILFAAGDRMFLFTLPILATAEPGTYPFVFEYEISFTLDADGSELGDGQGTLRVLDTTPIPEPSTWALLLAGLFGMALLARRRCR